MTSSKGHRWLKTVNSWQLHDIRSRGRPKYRWHDVMNDFLEKATGRVHRENDWQKAAVRRSMAKDLEKETSLMIDSDLDEL